jgi:hypothetical protein
MEANITSRTVLLATIQVQVGSDGAQADVAMSYKNGFEDLDLDYR